MKAVKMPMISVLMGVLCSVGKLNMLKEALGSIQDQTVKDIEILICDDGSDSEIGEFLEAAARNDERIKLIRPGTMITLPQKLNACLKHAQGDLIARMDDDDFSYPFRFEMQRRFLEEHQDIAFVGCCVDLFDHGSIVGQRRFPEYPEASDFLFRQPYVHPALMFRRSAFDLAGVYSEKKQQLLCEDYDILLRMYSVGLRGANINRCLFRYTLSQTAKGKKKYRYRINEARTRFSRFRALGMLPRALPYVIKPLVVGLIPNDILNWLRNRKDKTA